MISASKSTLSINKLNNLRPKVMKNLTNLSKKFCEFPPRSVNLTQREFLKSIFNLLNNYLQVKWRPGHACSGSSSRNPLWLQCLLQTIQAQGKSWQTHGWGSRTRWKQVWLQPLRERVQTKNSLEDPFEKYAPAGCDNQSGTNANGLQWATWRSFESTHTSSSSLSNPSSWASSAPSCSSTWIPQSDDATL